MRSRTSARPSRRSATTALFAYVVLSLLLFCSAWRSPTRSFVGWGGDPNQTMWFLTWTQYALTHGKSLFFTDHIFFPHGVNLLWNTSELLPGIVVTPITRAWGSVLAYNLLTTAAAATSAWCAFLACRRYRPGWAPAFAGGLVYGFSPFMMAHAGAHLQVITAFAPPLAAILVHDGFVARTSSPLRTGTLLGLLVSVQMFVFVEVVAIIAIGAAAALAAAAIVDRRSIRSRLGEGAETLLWGSVVFGALAAPAVYYMLFGPQRPTSPLHPPGFYRARPLNLVVPTVIQELHSPRLARATGGTAEGAGAYIGIALLALLAYTVWRYRADRSVRILAVAAALVVVLSLDPGVSVGHMRLSPIASLPVVGFVPSARLMLVGYLFIAFLVARAVDGIGWRRKRSAAVGAGALALTALTLLPITPFPASRSDVPPFFSGHMADRIPSGSVAVIVPQERTWTGQWAREFSWSTAAGARFKMLGGSAFVPDRIHPTPEWEGRRDARARVVHTLWSVIQGTHATHGDRTRLRRDLDELGVETVVVGRMFREKELVELFTAALGRPPDREGGVLVWWDVRGSLPRERTET